MQSDDTLIAGSWHSTDETPVPVRSSGQTQAAPVQTNGPALDIAQAGREPVSIAPQTNVNSRGMTASAMLGILLAVGGIGLYAGFGGDFAGQLTGGTSDVAIVVTADGQFAPDTVEIHPGQTVTIENKNVDPQVIKSKNGRDLFPVQVIFDTPYTFTVPAEANGPYIYYSETLPEDRILTFNVTAAPVVTETVESSAAAVAEEEAFDIPLPFGDGPLTVASSASSAMAVSSSAASERFEATVHSGETATISLSGAASSASSAETAPNGTVPTNPYTVGNAAATPLPNNLHGGAPVQPITKYPPKQVTSTGPEGVAFVLILSMLGVAFYSKRYCR